MVDLFPTRAPFPALDGDFVKFLMIAWWTGALVVKVLIGWHLHLDAQARERRGEPVRLLPSLGWAAGAVFLSWWLTLAFYHLFHHGPWWREPREHGEAQS